MQIADRLREAVLEAKRIKSHEGKRRQLQYIGRLMRDVDPAPLRAQLDALTGHSAPEAARHRRLEALREKLLADDEALTAYVSEHADADLQGLRTLIRNARREQKEARPPRPRSSARRRAGAGASCRLPAAASAAKSSPGVCCPAAPTGSSSAPTA
jgi:ribosome-associated protein